MRDDIFKYVYINPIINEIGLIINAKTVNKEIHLRHLYSFLCDVFYEFYFMKFSFPMSADMTNEGLEITMLNGWYLTDALRDKLFGGKIND